MLKTIIGYWRAALTALLTFGASALTFFAMRSRQSAKDKKIAQRKYERAVEIARKNAEIDREFDARCEEIAREVEKKKTSSELSDPNKW